MTEPDRVRGFSTLRRRVTLAASAVLLVVLAGGAVLFVGLLDARLVDAEHAAAQEVAETAADGWDENGRLPEGLDDDALIQVRRDGEVLAQSEDAAEAAVELEERDGAKVAIDGEVHVLAVDDADDAVVVAARSLEQVGEATTATAVLLAAAVPAIAALVALVVWVVAGRALRPAEAAQRAQRRFVADASHELRSPIASLRQHAEVAAAYPQSTDLAELAAVVDAESSRLAELVDALLLLARSDEPGGMRRELIDLDDLVLDEAARLRALGVAEVTVDVEPAQLRGDAGLLSRALRNLGDNARRHARSRIALSLHRDGDRAVIRVDDDGSGIPTEERARVFERFVRLDEARAREDGGAGLGLAIVAEAASRHGGTVAAAQAGLGGARLELRLPLR